MTSRSAHDEQSFEINRHAFTHLAAFVDRVTSVTAPLYALADRRPPRRIGSGVFFKHAGSTFLLSAAHVLHEVAVDRNLGIGGAATIVHAEGEARVSVASNDPFNRDVAVLQLTDACASELACGAIDVDDIAQSARRASGQPLLLVGYPAARSMNSYDPRSRSVEYQRLKILSIGSHPAEYATMAVDPATHVLSRFQRERAIAGSARATAPKLEGMSGCGLWVFDGMGSIGGLPVPNPEGKLIGIFTDYRRTQSALIATRVSEHLHTLQRQFLST